MYRRTRRVAREFFVCVWTLYQSTSRQLRQPRRNQKVLTRATPIPTTVIADSEARTGTVATAENPTRQLARVTVLHFKFPRAKRPVKFDANAGARVRASRNGRRASGPHRLPVRAPSVPFRLNARFQPAVENIP